VERCVGKSAAHLTPRQRQAKASAASALARRGRSRAARNSPGCAQLVDDALPEGGVRRESREPFASTRGNGARSLPQCGPQLTPGDEHMIKVSVMYPNTRGARFNHEYYRDKHMPLVKARMGDKCKYYTVDKGIAGATPDAPATYVAMCHLFCDSLESFQAGFGPHAKEIMADIPKYTDLSPVIQISEVVVG
jgi:uncharacterized protein (TIGR02118 family)